jgi:hypothetical protein
MYPVLSPVLEKGKFEWNGSHRNGDDTRQLADKAARQGQKEKIGADDQ